MSGHSEIQNFTETPYVPIWILKGERAKRTENVF